MTDLSSLGRQLVEDPPIKPTPRLELQKRGRRRNTRLAAAGVVVVLLAGLVTADLAASGQRPASRVRVIAPPSLPTGLSPAPTRPAALAVGPDGDLYIADDSLNEILKRLPDGRFVVVAGTGQAGFSGDGGPAAEARLDDPSGMAFGADGTLYFADQSNLRVRSITASGVIQTVAGGGPQTPSGFVTSGTPARRAFFYPSDVTFGPRGRLYIATGSQVIRLETDGTLTVVAGRPGSLQGIYGVGGPALAGSVDGANGMAFDAAGNLYLAGFNTKALLMVTPQGILTQPPGIPGFYPRGDAGLAVAPNGAVIGMDGLRLLTISPHGATPLFNFGTGPFLGITGFAPDGIAIGSDDTIYIDTYDGNGYSDRSAIAALHLASSTSQLLWETPSASTAPGSTTPRAATRLAQITLRASAVGSVAFGVSQSQAIAQLKRILGSSIQVSNSGECGISTTVEWPTLLAYFSRGFFVGYSTRDLSGQSAGGPDTVTETGMRVGDLLSTARHLYGSALTPSLAQGGSWSAITPHGTLDGFLTSEPNQTSAPPRIATIEAGAVGCPAVSP